jgi:hypothetical protein
MRAIFEPFAKFFRWFFDPRFEQLGARIEARLDELSTQATRSEADSHALSEALTESLSFLNRNTMDLNASITELTELRGRVQEMESSLVRLIDEVGDLERHLTAVPEGLGFLERRDSILLNRAESHNGYAAEKGLWFNPAVSLRYSTGNVELGAINERIVEVPFVFERMADLDLGARILDVGCAESMVAFSLASMGYEVTGIDLHPYPFDHPRLTTVVEAVENWEWPDGYFDAIVCLSSIEHFGLGVYGEDEQDGLDVRAMERITRWARPGAVLALTAPFGRYNVGSQQRTYDMPSLTRLLAGWKVESLRIAIRMKRGVGWTVIDGELDFEDADVGEHPAVILVSAEKLAE